MILEVFSKLIDSVILIQLSLSDKASLFVLPTDQNLLSLKLEVSLA